MLRKGEAVIVGDRDIEDLYTALVERDQANEGAINPIVTVSRCLKYPIQHAVIYESVPNENPPIPYGVPTRLTFIRLAEPHKQDKQEYVESVHAAASTALKERIEAVANGGASPGEIEILKRHLKGEYHSKRLTFAK